jgi:hypothetical protein
VARKQREARDKVKTLKTCSPDNTLCLYYWNKRSYDGEESNPSTFLNYLTKTNSCKNI